MLLLPDSQDMRNKTIKIKKSTLAIEAAPAAMPKNPNAPAIMAITRKITVQRNISYDLNEKIYLNRNKKLCHGKSAMNGEKVNREIKSSPELKSA
jgi:hypothetical protein